MDRIEGDVSHATRYAELSDAQPICQTHIAQAAQGDDGGRLEDVAGECVAGRQGQCGGVRDAQQADCVVIGEQCVEKGQNGWKGVEQSLQWGRGADSDTLGELQRLRVSELRLLRLQASLHRSGDHARWVEQVLVVEVYRQQALSGQQAVPIPPSAVHTPPY